MSDWSRHSHYTRSHLQRQKYVMPLWGAYEDTGKYFRCWNCGYICDVDRDGYDRGEGGSSGVIVKDFAEVSNPTYGFEDDLAAMCTNDDDAHIALRNGFDGEAITVYRHNHYPVIGGACPFCGTRNWR